MKCMLNVGNEIDMKEAAGDMAEAIVKILHAISETKADRETSLKALEMLTEFQPVRNINVSHCTFDNSVVGAEQPDL